MGNPFLNLLNDVTSAPDKEILQKLSPETQKYFSDAAMRQSDYNRQLDSIRTTLGGKTPEEMAQMASRWEPWQKDQRPEWERRFNQYPTLEAEKRDLEQKFSTAQAEINALKAASPNADGTIDASKLSQATRDLLNTELKPRLEGLVTRQELKGMMDEAIKTAVETSWSRTSENLLPLAMSAQELSQRYYREFGEPMGHEAFIKVAAESGRKGQDSLDFAWSKLAGPKLEAKQKADLAKQITDAEERGRMKGIAERDTHMNLPPGMEESTMPGFSMAPKIDSIDKLPADYELGKGGFQLAQLAADELRKMGAQRAQGQ